MIGLGLKPCVMGNNRGTVLARRLKHAIFPLDQDMQRIRLDDRPEGRILGSNIPSTCAARWPVIL
jgi:hypothetical protein